MAKKIEITVKQAQQFNAMLQALKLIGNGYETTDQLRRGSQKEWGLHYEEALEGAYENIQSTAKSVSKGVKAINILSQS